MSSNSLLNFKVLNKLTKNNNNAIRTNPKKLVQIFTDVEFGVLSKECRNYGICRIENISSVELNNEPEPKRVKAGAISIFTLSPDGQLEMTFPKSKLENQTAERYFRTGKFIVQEDFKYWFNKELKHAPALFTIKKGEYQVNETLGCYIVRF